MYIVYHSVPEYKGIDRSIYPFLLGILVLQHTPVKLERPKMELPVHVHVHVHQNHNAQLESEATGTGSESIVIVNTNMKQDDGLGLGLGLGLQALTFSATVGEMMPTDSGAPPALANMHAQKCIRLCLLAVRPIEELRKRNIPEGVLDRILEHRGFLQDFFQYCQTALKAQKQQLIQAHEELNPSCFPGPPSNRLWCFPSRAHHRRTCLEPLNSGTGTMAYTNTYHNIFFSKIKQKKKTLSRSGRKLGLVFF